MTEAEKFQNDSHRANTNLLLMGFLHFLSLLLLVPFFASLGYAIHLGYWKPFWVATLTMIASILVSAIIGGIFGYAYVRFGGSAESVNNIGFIMIPLGSIPPFVSFMMFRSRVLALRQRVMSA